jgi:hypothetical protein
MENTLQRVVSFITAPFLRRENRHGSLRLRHRHGWRRHVD